MAWQFFCAGVACQTSAELKAGKTLPAHAQLPSVYFCYLYFSVDSEAFSSPVNQFPYEIRFQFRLPDGEEKKQRPSKSAVSKLVGKTKPKVRKSKSKAGP